MVFTQCIKSLRVTKNMLAMMSDVWNIFRKYAHYSYTQILAFGGTLDTNTMKMRKPKGCLPKNKTPYCPKLIL